MAKKSNSSNNSTKKRFNWLSLFSFVAVMLLGLGITISVVMGWVGVSESISGMIKNVAIAIALVIPCVYSYRYARKMGNVWFILWIIAVVLVVVFYILGIALPNPFNK